MVYKLYNQNVLDSKHAFYGGVEALKTYLQPFHITDITTQTVCQPHAEYINVPWNDANNTATYVIIQQGDGDTFAYFVKDQERISASTLRLYLEIDTVSTFLSDDTELTNGYFVRTNNPYTPVISHSLMFPTDGLEINYRYDYSLGIEFSAEYRIILIAQILGGNHKGEIVLLRSIGKLDASDIVHELALSSFFAKITFYGDANNDIEILKMYVLPKEIAPPDRNVDPDQDIDTVATLFYSITTLGKSDTFQCWWPGEVYGGQVYKVEGKINNVKPENVYRIGTFTDYMEIANPSYIGDLTYNIKVYSDLTQLRVVVEYEGEERDITNGLELPVLDATQAIRNAQHKMFAITSNALSVIGQFATSIASFASQNYLAGALSLGGVAKSSGELVATAQQRIKGGLLTSDNAGIINLQHGFLIGVVVGEPYYRPTLSDIVNKGYFMRELYTRSDMPATGKNYYYEISAEWANLPSAFVDNFLARLKGGLYIGR